MRLACDLDAKRIGLMIKSCGFTVYESTKLTLNSPDDKFDVRVSRERIAAKPSNFNPRTGPAHETSSTQLSGASAIGL